MHPSAPTAHSSVLSARSIPAARSVHQLSYSSLLLFPLPNHVTLYTYCMSSLIKKQWSILQFWHLQPHVLRHSCGPFCNLGICNHVFSGIPVVHFAILAFATTCSPAFLWFILQFWHLQPHDFRHSCGPFCDFGICNHMFSGIPVIHFMVLPFATT